MSEPSNDAPAGMGASIKAALPAPSSVAALAMSAGAGLAGGGMLDQQLTEVIGDLTTKWGADKWLTHPGSWAGLLIFAGGIIAHIISQPKKGP